MELMEILDSNGNPTGQILDKEQIHKLGLFHKEVAIFLINNQKEILLQRRAKTKEIEPNKWAWHGGHVKALESNVNAIIREVKEELGLTLTKKSVKVLIQLKSDKMPNRHFTYAYYAFCNCDTNELNIQKEELSEIKWFSFDDLKKMIFSSNPDIMFKNNENTNKIIKALEEIINI